MYKRKSRFAENYTKKLSNANKRIEKNDGH